MDTTTSKAEVGQIPEGFRDGYPALAKWMAYDPDSESLIFRKFDQLAVRNMLHLQSQCLDLEAELECFDNEARGSEILSLSRHETFVGNAKVSTNEREQLRMKFMDALDDKMKKYRK
jgi:hypothetical protein